AAAFLATVALSIVLVAVFAAPGLDGSGRGWWHARQLVPALPPLAALSAWGWRFAPRVGTALAALTVAMGVAVVLAGRARRPAARSAARRRARRRPDALRRRGAAAAPPLHEPDPRLAPRRARPHGRPAGRPQRRRALRPRALPQGQRRGGPHGRRRRVPG